ncbi:MAG: peroxiredoxin [Gammaproteobacteria bacterium]|jgi:peroxiredoxin
MKINKMLNNKICKIILLIVMLATAHSLSSAEESDFRRPDFSMTDLEGAERSISEWDGNAMLINFWASWCVPCKREIPLLNDISIEHKDKDFQVLGIAVDTPENIKNFIKTTPLNYLTLVDEDKSQDVAYQLTESFLVLPLTVFLDHQGRIFWMQVEEIHRDEVDAILNRIWQLRSGELDYDKAQTALVADLDRIYQERLAE